MGGRGAAGNKQSHCVFILITVCIHVRGGDCVTRDSQKKPFSGICQRVPRFRIHLPPWRPRMQAAKPQWGKESRKRRHYLVASIKATDEKLAPEEYHIVGLLPKSSTQWDLPSYILFEMTWKPSDQDQINSINDRGQRKSKEIQEALGFGFKTTSLIY